MHVNACQYYPTTDMFNSLFLVDEGLLSIIPAGIPIYFNIVETLVCEMVKRLCRASFCPGEVITVHQGTL